MGEVTADARVVLIYDGECSMCRASALWLLRRAEAGGARDIEILPCRSPVRRQRFPAIADETCMEAMQLVLPGGHVLGGADAVPEILRRIPRWRWIATVFALPGVRPFARRVYAWIARNRMRISCARPTSAA
jgi:predicted DCC family thiol-disulfide oxidoreductase YuxK